jgi:hypothetical protein
MKAVAMTTGNPMTSRAIAIPGIHAGSPALSTNVSTT